DNSFKMTPTEAAGLLTNLWTFPGNAAGGADVVNHCPAQFGSPCSLVYALNVQKGFATPQRYGAYVRSDPTSATGEFFDWICTAPNVPVEVDGKVIHDPNTGPKVLEAAYAAESIKITGCPATMDQ